MKRHLGSGRILPAKRMLHIYIYTLEKNTILSYQIQLTAFYFAQQFCKYAIVVEAIFVKLSGHVTSSIFQLLLKKSGELEELLKTRRAPLDLTEAEGTHSLYFQKW